MEIERIPEWALTNEDETQIARLVACCFDTDFGGRSFFQTRHHLRLVHREGPIVAHMALQFRAMRLDGRLISVAGLAEVATDPDHRGKGLASGLLRAAIAEARVSPAEYLLLFGTAKLYQAAGFVTVHNPMTWLDLRGAVTGDIRHEAALELMVLPLRDRPWEPDAPLDLLGATF